MAVDEFDMTAEGGEIVGLVRPNGAGKTTVFNMVAGFYQPDSGRILFRGRDLAGLKPYQICALGIARTFQVAPPFTDITMLENVMVEAYGRVRSTRGDRRKNLEVLQLVDFVDRGDVMVHELTTADHKRLELARALTTEPKLLLMEKPMAGLNPTKRTTCWNFCETSAAGGSLFSLWNTT